MRDKIAIFSHGCPWLGGDLVRCFIAKVVYIHDFAAKNRASTLDIDQIPHVLEFPDSLLRRSVGRLQIREGLVDIGSDLWGRCIVPNDVKKLKSLRLVRFTNELEQVVEEITVVG